MKFLTTSAVLALFPIIVHAETDPLNSGNWDWVKEFLFDDAKTVFDDRVAVSAPAFAEDNMNVPFAVDARGLDDIEKIVVFADANPIIRVLSFEPHNAEPYIASALKMQQGGPVRAAALTSDGIWHVGGTFVSAAGGGCTAPASVHADDSWVDHLMEMHARAWQQSDQSQKVTMRVYHPMDTGLADGIPAYYLDDISITASDSGELLARIEPAEPMTQHPTITVLVKPEMGTPAVTVEGRDIDANELYGEIELSWGAS